MPYDYEVKFNLDACIKKLGLNEQGRVQSFVTNEVLRLSEPYVPFLTGALKGSGHVEGTDVVWKTPYARRMYYGDEDWNWTGGSPHGPNWVDRMLQNGGLIEIEKGARRIASK